MYMINVWTLATLHLIVIVREGSKGILQDVWGMGQIYQGQGSSIHSLGVTYPSAKHTILHLADKIHIYINFDAQKLS